MEFTSLTNQPKSQQKNFIIVCAMTALEFNIRTSGTPLDILRQLPARNSHLKIIIYLRLNELRKSVKLRFGHDLT